MVPTDFKKELHTYNYRITPTRLLILQLLEKNHRPMTVEKIAAGLKNKNIDMATIYRNLLSFEKSGLVKRVDINKKAAHFELSSAHHHHIVCTDCGEIEDFENDTLEYLIEKTVHLSSHFKHIQKHSLELFGVCKTCEKK